MSAQDSASDTTLAVQNQSASLWTTGPMPLDWPPFPACYFFNCAEQTMLVNIAKGKVGEDGVEWRCDGCDERFEYSAGLFYHIVKHRECGAWLCAVRFTVGQMLAILAAVDYKNVEDLVETYVDRWERLDFPDSEYVTRPLVRPSRRPSSSSSFSSSSSSSSSRSSSIDGVRVFPQSITRRRRLSNSQHTRVSPPSTQASSRSSTTKADGIPAANHVAEPDEAEANCYDANHNTYMHRFMGTGANCDGTIADFAAQNIFPLQAPDTLLDKDEEKYDKLIDRIQTFAAHRLHYLAPNSNYVRYQDQLMADWNANVEGGKEYKTYQVWQSRRAHDLNDIKDLLMQV